MDSSHHERGPPKESSSENSSSPLPPPPVAPPHTMYYPQGGIGYPPGQAHPQPYPYPPPGYAPYGPNHQPHHPYNYPPPPSYYGAPPQTYHSHGGGRAFIRGFVMCSCLLFTTFFLVTIVMALVLHPQLPIYKVSSLSVTNFNTTPVLSGDWNISIAIENPNDRLKGQFSDWEVDLTCGNGVVAVSYVPEFELEKKEVKQLEMKTSSNGANGMSFQKWDIDAMEKRRQFGAVMFIVRVSSMVTFKTSTMTTRSTMIVAICDDLKVVFQNNTGTGTLDNGGKPVDCMLYL
ncbi:hypothetical protein SESBI_49668 [Sesbania bispinosa]|nr:hypothetical protein SESBI_49668 [Sesbania bispinosa]